MKRIAILAAALLILTGCSANHSAPDVEDNEISADTDALTETSTETIPESESFDNSDIEETEEENEISLQIEVNGHTLTATLADHEAAQALTELIQSEPLTLNLHEYGSFEKVGPLPQSLPTDDENITTEPGDIMLYQGNQITIFYGSNTWSYTRLGRIDTITQAELKDILGEGDITVVLSLSNRF